MKSIPQKQAPAKPGDVKSYANHGPVATGQSQPSGVSLDRDLAQGYIVIVFVYVLIGALILAFYILRLKSRQKSKAKK